MIFYVYLDPKAVSSACDSGGSELMLLIAALNDFSQNCFLVDFDNCWVQNEIYEKLKNILGDFEVAKLKKMFSHFVKNNLFINPLTYDYGDSFCEEKNAAEMAESFSIDLLVLCPENVENTKSAAEITSLSIYPATHFEELRRECASSGLTLRRGELRAEEFLEIHLRKALQFARRIEILDFQCGEKYKENYVYSLGKFLGWIESINKENPKITFHCGYPGDQAGIVMYDELDGLNGEEILRVKKNALKRALNSHYTRSEIEVVCYEDEFPHERFLLTNQIAFTIGRGIDLFDPKSGYIRDIDISIKDLKKVRALLPKYF